MTGSLIQAPAMQTALDILVFPRTQVMGKAQFKRREVSEMDEKIFIRGTYCCEQVLSAAKDFGTYLVMRVKKLRNVDVDLRLYFGSYAYVRY